MPARSRGFSLDADGGNTRRNFIFLDGSTRYLDHGFLRSAIDLSQLAGERSGLIVSKFKALHDRDIGPRTFPGQLNPSLPVG
jgi:hypothetical protein